MKLVIPTKIVPIGDRQTVLHDMGFARVQMEILEGEMRHNGLSQGSRTRRAPHGSVVECWSCFDLRQITITAPPRPGGEPKPPRQWCYCNGCIALAKITAVHDITFLDDDPSITEDDLCYDRVDSYPARVKYYGGYPAYDAYVCAGSSYVIFEGIGAIDNMPYCVGDKVLVAPYPHIADAETAIEQFCYQACGPLCFASASSPLISVVILPIDVSIIPWWFEE